MGQDKRGLGQGDTPTAAQVRAGATVQSALPPQLFHNLLSSAGLMDWAPTACPAPAASQPPSPLPSPPCTPREGPLTEAGGGTEISGSNLGSGIHSGVEHPPPTQHSQPLATALDATSFPPEPMEGVETAIILPDEGIEGELVDLARMATRDMADVITRRQVDAAIAHVISHEPCTWQEALGVGDSASCPHNLRAALRAYLQDICPEMRPVPSEDDMGPDPSQAYPTPSPATDYPAAAPPEPPAMTPGSPSPPGPASRIRRSPRESRPPSTWWQSHNDPAQEGQGGPS